MWKNSFYENVKRALPHLPDAWGVEHHLARIHIRAAKMSNVVTMAAQLEMVNEIAKFDSKLRLNFLAKQVLPTRESVDMHTVSKMLVYLFLHGRALHCH